MKKAVVTGSTGLVGISVVKYFSAIGIEVLCLGRRDLSSAEVTETFGVKVKYFNLPMESISSLEENINLIRWFPGSDCVFFNFAWSGYQKLTDGGFDEQLNNAIYTANAVRAAKNIGCTKFVNAGTIEETFAEQWMSNKANDVYKSTQTNYAIAKLAARDLCKMVAYLEKIDYIHTRLSVPLAPNLSQGSYIASVLKKIASGEPYELPINDQLFDIIFTDDVARAYYLIGQRGKNKADYFIGTSRPATLIEYFKKFEQIVNGIQPDVLEIRNDAKAQLFDTSKLQVETGFVSNIRFQDLPEYI